MFKKLRNRIIIVTMAVTTAVLVLSGVLIMTSSSNRPEPKPLSEPDFSAPNPAIYDSQEMKDYIEKDRKEGDERLLITLLCVGATIEIVVFLVVSFTSSKIIRPVKDSYEKQKLFIANASHELKTPLAVIQANVEALSVDKSSEKWKENIETEITRANRLVLDLLSLAKMDAGKSEKRVAENVDLKAEIEELVKLYAPKFKGKINFKAGEVSPQYLLPRQDMVQALEILLDNATKYGDKKVNIKLNAKTLSIKNDGAVVPKEDTEKIFDRFYQVDKAREGSGLGLAIIKAVCERNNWQISCVSSEKFTEFVLKF